MARFIRPSLSFRSKLILAMSLIVAGVTAVTIYVSINQIESAYTQLFSDKFRAQIQFFNERQQQRLEGLATACESAAKSEALRAALAKGQSDAAYGVVLREVAPLFPSLQGSGDLDLSTVLGPEDENPARPRAPARSARRFAAIRPFVRIVEANGAVLPPPSNDSRFPMAKAPLRELRNKRLQRLLSGKKDNSFRTQETGYTALDTEDMKTQLSEFVVTPIYKTDDASVEPMGVLVVEAVFSNLEEIAMTGLSEGSELGSLQSGIWIAGKIYSRTIPQNIADLLSKRLAAEVKSDSSVEGEFSISLNGEPYRVIFSELNPNSPLDLACQISLFSMSRARKEERELAYWIAGSGAFALAGALILILVLSRRLTGPINQLVAATHEIRRGNYEYRVPVQSRDELGILSDSFNHMAEDLSESRKYVTVLSQVTDKDVAQAMLRGEVSLGGELREVSVLFCDIRGFTAHTQGMPPAEIFSMLNEHMTAMTDVVHAHHGVVDKFVGDMIMAVFGAPASYGSDALNSAKCALDMIAERERLNATSAHNLTVGIGIATGLSIAGCMGSESRLNYTVLGERVNLASRLCSSADAMEILIDDITAEELDSSAELESLPPLQLKGFPETVCASRLLAIHKRGETPAEAAV